MPYTAWSVSFNEQPSASKWNILGTNDAAFNNGSGLPTANAGASYVATSETTTSTSYTGLTTPLTKAVTVGASGLLLVGVSSRISNSNSGSGNYAGFALSGANTLAAADKYAVEYEPPTGAYVHQTSGSWLLTGLSAGSTTITAQYRVTGTTGTFDTRHVWGVPF